MRYQITLLNEPNQEISADLEDKDGKNIYVDFAFRTFSDGSLCANISFNGEVVRNGIICHNLMPLLPNNNYGGNFYFEDKYGNEDPNFEDFNDRFMLVWDTEYIIS